MVKLAAILLSAVACIVVTSSPHRNSHDPTLNQGSVSTHTHVPHKIKYRNKHLNTVKNTVINSERTSIKKTLSTTNTTGRKTNERESDEVTKIFQKSTTPGQTKKSSKVLERKGTTLEINEADTDTLGHDTLQIIKDFCLDEDYTEVIISSPQHLQQITTFNNMEKTITPMVIIDTDNLEFQLAGAETVMLEDNKQLLYLLVDIQDNVTSLIQTIKESDKRSKLVLLPSDRVNPYQFYKQHELHDVYIMTTHQNCYGEDCHGRYGLYEICLYCNYGEHQVNKINKWIPGPGFIQPLKLPLSFKNTFNQATFQVGTMFIHPYIYVDGTDTHGNDIVTGDLVYHLLDTLSQTINASFRYVGARSTKQLDKQLDNRDIQLIGWPFRMQQIKHSGSGYLGIGQIVIVSAKPPRGMSWYGVVAVFDRATWFLIILTWVLGGAALYKMRKHITHGEVANYGDSYWTLAQVILWDSIQGQNHPFSVCILLITFMLGIFLLVTLYTGDLVAYILAQDYTYLPIDNLEELWASDKTVLTYWDWNEGYAEKFNKSIDRFETFALGGGDKWFVPALEKIRGNPDKYVTVEKIETMDHVLQIYMGDPFGNHMFYVSKDGSDFFAQIFPVQIHSYYEEAVNRGMLRMQAAGLPDHLGEHYKFKTFVQNMKAARSRPIISTDPQMVTLQHGFAGGLVLLFSGYTLALFCLIFNIIHKKYKAAIKSMMKTPAKPVLPDQKTESAEQ